MSVKMSEKEKIYFFCLLFPILWPFIPVLLVCDAVEATKRVTVRLYRKLRGDNP